MNVIVTESLSCMTPELCRLNNTVIVPVDCYINKKRYSDRITNDVPPPEESYSLPPKVEVYDRVFNKIIASGDNVICITTSSKISSAYKSAIAAAEKYDPERIRVVDSGVVAGGLYLMVKHLRKMFDDDDPIDVIYDELETYKKTIKVKFTSHDSERLVNSNRLVGQNAVRKPILNQKPIFVMEEGSIIHKSSASPGFREVSELISGLESPEHIVLHYLEKNTYLREIGKMLKQKYPESKIYTLPITLALKINLGTSIIGIIGD